MEQQIFKVAMQLTAQGKKATVALVKSKLSSNVPMPMLLKTLNHFSALSPQERFEIAGQDEVVTVQESSVDLEKLAQQVDILREELRIVQQELTLLKKTQRENAQ
ncbi:MAG: hypothetical protein HRU25_08520 [Psychrobium sp.]|nr:hypothetical protein [Psychrobium sp.]